MSGDVFLARQPILDRDLRTFGYELLYRDDPSVDGRPVGADPQQATTSVMHRAVLDWGMSRLIGDRFGFINASPRLVVDEMHLALPPEGIILELPADARYDNRTVEALDRAHRAGYHFALDNVRTVEGVANAAALHLVSMVKIEISRSRPEHLMQMAEIVRQERAGALLIAEKVETAEDYALAIQADFDLFEGYFFARPELLRRTSHRSNAAAAISLLAEIQRADIDIDRIEELVGSDPSLAYRLLAVVNSSAFGLDRHVESIRHAIVMLGIVQVRYLATLIALSAEKDTAEELLTTGATRARLAATIADQDDRSAAFTVGLLSVLEALYRTPMEELLEELPVTDEIREALVDRTGPYARYLDVVEACERADLARLGLLMPDRLRELQEAYNEAIEFADQLRGQLVGKKSKLTLPHLPHLRRGRALVGRAG